DRATNEDTSTGAIAFTIGDAETAAGGLTVTRASSNTTLVPLANVVLGGSAPRRTASGRRARGRGGRPPDGLGDAGAEPVRQCHDHGDGERRRVDRERCVRGDGQPGQRSAGDYRHRQ